MHSAFIAYKSSKIHYIFFGAGKKLLLCLHGYNGSCFSFNFLQNDLPEEYSLVALDLPFHGKTIWNEGLLFEMSDLLAIIEKITIHHFPGIKKYLIMGFSMGGRLALSILQHIPQRIERLILLAPDGLKVNAWYWLATQSLAGNKLFDFTMNNPRWFFYLLRFAYKAGIINHSVFKFSEYYIQNEPFRRQLYETWTCMRKFKPAIPAIKRSIRKYDIKTRLLYGQYDRIIVHSRGAIFRKGIEAHCDLKILDCGHQVLQHRNAADIVSAVQL